MGEFDVALVLLPVSCSPCPSQVLVRGRGENNTDPCFPDSCSTAPSLPATPRPGPLSWQSDHRLTMERWQLANFLAGPLGAGGSLRVDLCSSSRTQEGGDRQAAASLEQSQKLQIPVASLWGLIWRPVGIYSICPHIAWEMGAPVGIGVAVLGPDPSAWSFSACSPIFCSLTVLWAQSMSTSRFPRMQQQFYLLATSHNCLAWGIESSPQFPEEWGYVFVWDCIAGIREFCAFAHADILRLTKMSFSFFIYLIRWSFHDFM